MIKKSITFVLLSGFIVTGCGKRNFGDISVTLINSVTKKEIVKIKDDNQKLNQVELPPLISLKADVLPYARAVKFILPNGSVVTDDKEPFLLDIEQAKIVSVSSEMGIYTIEISAYDKQDSLGKEVAYLKQGLFFSLDGMDPDFKYLSIEDNEKWVKENLDSVLQKKTFLASNGYEMPYRIFLPDHYSEVVNYPLLVFLHGRGQRGTDNGPQIYHNGLFLGNKSIVSPNMQYKYPSVILVPQCSDKTVMEEWAHWIGNSIEHPFKGLGNDGSYHQHNRPSDSGQAFLELLERVIKNYSIDKSRIYLTGISMGGFGTWEFITRRPQLFTAAVPMAGYSDPRQAAKITHIPIWIFHGNADQWNPVEGSRIMYQTLREAGGNVRYTEYENVDHGASFKRAFAERKLLPWLFSQKKTK